MFLLSTQESIVNARQSIGSAKNRAHKELNDKAEQLSAEKREAKEDLAQMENSIHEQRSVCEDLNGDNLQIAQEAKEIVSSMGSTFETNTSNHVKNLLEEKVVLERTIVGLESKVMELKREKEQSDVNEKDNSFGSSEEVSKTLTSAISAQSLDHDISKV